MKRFGDMSDFERFVLDHADDDCNRLLLGRDKWPGIDIDLAVNTIEGRRRIRTRLPEWYACTSVIYPTRLCTEQCSSAATASYKASVAAERIFPGRPFRVADLTAGLGSDVLAFARASLHAGNSSRAGGDGGAICREAAVLYNDMDPALAEAARHNLPLFGINALVRNREVAPGKIREILGDFIPDLLFLDPARRDSSGKKVFLLEDCRPDVLPLLDELFSISRHILLKLSPMADISMLLSRLAHVREVHVVAFGGECRELLLWLDREYGGGTSGPQDRLLSGDCAGGEAHSSPQDQLLSGDCANGVAAKLVCCEDGAVLEVEAGAESAAAPLWCTSPEDLHGWLFVPGKSLTKAGLFKTISSRFSLLTPSPDSHLYISHTSPNISDIVPADTDPATEPAYTAPADITPADIDPSPSLGPAEAAPFGKYYEILEALPLSSTVIRTLKGKYPSAEVTSRGTSLSSEALRRRLGIRPAQDRHIFALSLAASGTSHLLVTRPVS